MEQIRTIQVSAKVDTNKQTYTLNEECDSFADAEEKVSEFFDGLAIL